ncbi:MAG TPA: DUF1800 domain-containing protein [Terracidiphilus sp.]|nr:DUF1800 domain-containing protein [Terracidiphilus sp.]
MKLFHGPIAAVLCAGMLCLCPACPAGFGQSQPGQGVPAHPNARRAYASSQLQGDARILHALNRLTFGPRPGDLEAVRAMGLDKWFDRQLHPQSLDETALKTRLAEFPAMQWGTPDLLFYLPSNAVLRAAMNGRVPIPDSGILPAVYQNQMSRIRERQQARKQPEPGAKAAAALTDTSQTEPAMTMERAVSPTPMNKAVFPHPNPADAANSMDAASMDAAARPGASARPGFNAAFFASVTALDPGPRLIQLANMRQPELDAFLRSLKPRQREQLVAGMDPGQREQVGALENPERVVAEELIAERLTRDIYSNAQLQEVMTDFWLNHFNVYLRKNEQMPYYLVSYARDTIRPNALGKFEDLLEAVAHSPAMLLYLDNASSIGPDSRAAEHADLRESRRPNAKHKAPEGLNENYGRELMELHTVGVNGGYTQKDVIQAARILTGWTVQRPLRGGGFFFNGNRHQPGTETVMGKKFKDYGEQQGINFLHFLATRPATAQFLSLELAQRFVSDDPPKALVDRMAHTYLSSGGDISAVLKTLFHSPEFWAAGGDNAKVKTPLEFVVSAVRASGADVKNLRPLANALRQMGMPLYGCVPPTGYSWQQSAWVSTGDLVDRMNFALALAANRLPGIRTTWNANAAAVADASPDAPTPQAEEARLQALLLPGGVSDSTRAAVLAEFEKQNAHPQQVNTAHPELQGAGARQLTIQEREDQLMAGLLLGSPEFQHR